MSNIDTINNKILHELTKSARMTNTELANKVGLSPSACLRRVQDLEANGIIKGYRVVLDKEQLGIKFIAYVMVGLSEHTKKSQTSFEQTIAHADEVKECHNVTGSFEYILRVETTDLKQYKRFHTDVLGVLPQVATISTHVLMESTKDQRE
jgi:Lrp/AsnC family leucine-responsive transcriptional regulator